jgi:hypothetical protein
MWCGEVDVIFYLFFHEEKKKKKNYIFYDRKINRLIFLIMVTSFIGEFTKNSALRHDL